MPLFTAEIPETHLRINRPVIKQVVDDILLRFKDIPFREFRFLGNIVHNDELPARQLMLEHSTDQMQTTMLTSK